jgi:hypothetical protein
MKAEGGRTAELHHPPKLNEIDSDGVEGNVPRWNWMGQPQSEDFDQGRCGRPSTDFAAVGRNQKEEEH